MSRRALVVANLVGAALCFSLGWFMSHVADTPKREPTATPSSKPMLISDDAGVAGPLLLIDPSKVTLLPDASLNLETPKPPSIPGQTNE